MLIKDFLPRTEVSDYVRCFRIVHMVSKQSIVNFSKYYIPKPEMVFHAIVKGIQKIKLTTTGTEEFSYKYFLSGQQTKAFILNSHGELLDVQIVFHPTAFFKITGIPSSEIANNFVDANLIFGDKVLTYFEQLQYATSYHQMINIAEQFVLALIKTAKIYKTQIDFLFTPKLYFTNHNSIKQLSNESYLSSKQFKRLFFEKVGVNPKIYFKIMRFNTAYNIKNAKPDWDWLRIAIECDYYDYQHLCKEYLDFTNLTPAQYHQQIEPFSPEMQLGIAKEVYVDRFHQLRLK